MDPVKIDTAAMPKIEIRLLCSTFLEQIKAFYDDPENAAGARRGAADMKAHGAKRPGRMMRPEVGLARWEIMRHVERTRNKGCRGCRYWCEYGTCDYILREGHRRGVPMAPGGGCEKKTTKTTGRNRK